MQNSRSAPQCPSLSPGIIQDRAHPTPFWKLYSLYQDPGLTLCYNNRMLFLAGVAATATAVVTVVTAVDAAIVVADDDGDVAAAATQHDLPLNLTSSSLSPGWALQ